MTALKKIIVVVGATGQQGGSVVQNILGNDRLNSEYRVRGTTRDKNSDKSKSLEKDGVELVDADVTRPETLKTAFEGAHVVFGNTVTVYDGHAYQHEVQHGKALVDAAVCAGVPYYIYSTLPNAGKISGGKLKNMGHFDGKEEVECYIRTLPIKSAFISPGCFMSNFHLSMKPHKRPEGGYELTTPVSPHTKLPLLDTSMDTGKWVALILADFDKHQGKTIPCATGLYSMSECCEAMSAATGQRVSYRQIPEEMFKKFLPPTMTERVTEMLGYFQDYGYYGMDTEAQVRQSAALVGERRLTALDQYLKRSPLVLD